MNLLERCISLLAPHTCLVCGQEGTVLCSSCTLAVCPSHPSRCYRCHKATSQSRVCAACRRIAPLKHVWVGTRYEGSIKELIHKLKFERASATATVLAGVLGEQLPLLPDDVLVVHIPTVPARVRVRGYDQAQLIARSLSNKRGWKYQPLLKRVGHTRQVGAQRTQRFEQMQHVFYVKKSAKITGAHILLIDDVLTTGATVEAAATALKKAGAKTIDAAVFAGA